MNDCLPEVAILMATYNGAPYLRAQVQSILDQSYANWRLYVRDDCSDDATPDILARLSEEFPDRIHVIPSCGERLGADGNFVRLLEKTTSEYFMFCDQDDVWLPHKVERSMARMRLLEAEVGPGAPLLVYSDLRVVSPDLNCLDDSVWHYGNHNPEFGARLNRLLVQNMVFGCTILMSSALARVALPFPSEAVQYDWWLALVAVCLGRTAYVSEPTAMYRLHTGNAVGARQWGLSYVLKKISRVFDRTNGPRANLTTGQRQAGALFRRYENQLSPEHKEMLRTYAQLGQLGFWGKRKALVHHRFFKVGFVRNVGLFALV